MLNSTSRTPAVAASWGSRLLKSCAIPTVTEFPLGNSPDCAADASLPLSLTPAGGVGCVSPVLHPYSETASMASAASSKRARFLSLGILLLPFYCNSRNFWAAPRHIPARSCKPLWPNGAVLPLIQLSGFIVTHSREIARGNFTGGKSGEAADAEGARVLLGFSPLGTPGFTGEPDLFDRFRPSGAQPASFCPGQCCSQLWQPPPQAHSRWAVPSQAAA